MLPPQVTENSFKSSILYSILFRQQFIKKKIKDLFILGTNIKDLIMGIVRQL